MFQWCVVLRSPLSSGLAYRSNRFISFHKYLSEFIWIRLSIAVEGGYCRPAAVAAAEAAVAAAVAVAVAVAVAAAVAAVAVATLLAAAVTVRGSVVTS